MSSEKLDYLFKFTEADTGLEMLQTRSLRWSSPECYGDPFELSSDSPLGFDAKSLLDSTIKLASSMIFAPEQPKGDSPLINAIKRWRDEGRFASPEEAHGVLRELLSKMVDYRACQLDSSLAQWQEFIRNTRVCSFSGKPENLLAWQQFAGKHTGLALRFDASAAVFSSARQVIYQAERPQLTSLREQLGAILHNRKDGLVERFKDHHLIKGAHLKGEQEWRCQQMSKKSIAIDHNQSSEWFDNVAFAPDSLSAVYFGLRLDEEVKKQVADILQQSFKHTKIFQAVIAKTGYGLEFEKVNK